jgi:hypothetical protein
MTSYDDSVRYEEINEKFQEQQSGLNLFYLDPSDIPSLMVPTDAKIIAFDLPTEFVTSALNKNVSSPEPLPIVNIDSGWKFMGFDVVDPRTQTSAFHGFDHLAISLRDVMGKYSLRFNAHGLINGEDAATKLAKFFDALILEHAPFLPCGVWLKEEQA